MDNRFPHMLSLSSESLPGLDSSRLGEARRIADAIRRRTGRSVCYNAHTGGLHVYLKPDDVDSGIHELPFLRPDGRGFAIRERNPHDIDTVCRWLQRGSMPKRLKDRLVANEKAEREKEKEQRLGVHCAEASKGAERTLRRVRDRRGMGKSYRPSAVVHGLKGV